MLDILYAGNCLRACLHYPSMARSEVDRELEKPSIVPGQPAIEVNFKAAMALLKERYSANTATDIDTLRSELQAMNDKGPDNLHGYKRDYLTAAGILGDKVTPAEHRDWVFKGITCEEICQNVTLPLRMRLKDALTHTELFDEATMYMELRALQSHDPYKKASGPRDVRSANSASTSQSSGTRIEYCSRCWSTEHKWQNCHATNCQACGAMLPNGERVVCPKLLSHPQPYRFYKDILPWERFKKSNGRKFDNRSNKRSSDRKPREDKPDKASKLDVIPSPAEKKDANAAQKNKKRKDPSEGVEAV
jgi:hypothetical protein